MPSTSARPSTRSTRHAGKPSVFQQVREGLIVALASARGTPIPEAPPTAPPPPRLSAQRLVLARKRTGMSEELFAQFLNVPKRTLQAWERGVRTPKGGDARL